MSAMPETVTARVASVRERVARAAAAAGRTPGDIEMIAVTKSVAIPAMREAAAAGIAAFGENRVQEFMAKADLFLEINWHIIGHLQSNKVKYIIGRCALVHSVDRESLAAEIDRRCRAQGIAQPVLVEVNIGREPQKSGVMPDALWALLDSMLAMPGISVRGLMAIPPMGEPARPWFARMRQLMDEAKRRYPQVGLTTLSMGMSADFEQAIAEGATMIRVGSALFGPRAPQAVREG
ncbi:MAG: YggS family pyridoxal phosphate-dependent enzyme [Christensenellales bacterium]|jgi:pyridoxal phosphate enzyme (YggS family)